MDKKTISTEILKENGYTEHKGKFSKPEERFFQKKVTDKIGIKYFINCQYYSLSNNRRRLRFWDFSIQIDTPNGSVDINTVQWFNQDGIHSQRTIKDVEEYFEKMWVANNSPYYEEFGGGE